jgi:hypothetical protein
MKRNKRPKYSIKIIDHGEGNGVLVDYTWSGRLRRRGRFEAELRSERNVDGRYAFANFTGESRDEVVSKADDYLADWKATRQRDADAEVIYR